MFFYLDAETTHLMDSLWLEVKTEGDIDLVPIIGTSVIIAGMACYLVTHTVREKRRKARRGQYRT